MTTKGLNSSFITILITVQLGLVFRQSKCELPFQPLGSTGALTRTLLRNDDVPSDAILVSLPGFPLLQNQTASMLFVSDNGLISFDQEFAEPPQSPGSDFSTVPDDTPIIAPFWSDNDIRMSGQVRYEVYEAGTLTQIDSELSEVSQFIANETKGEFNATWMLLAEWRDCHPFPHAEPTAADPATIPILSMTNTYQAILITNQDSQSYAIFIYECDLIEWSGLDPIYARVGLAADAGIFSLHPLSGNESVNGIDCLNNPQSQIVNFVYDLNTFDIVGYPTPSSSVPIMSSTVVTNVQSSSDDLNTFDILGYPTPSSSVPIMSSTVVTNVQSSSGQKTPTKITLSTLFTPLATNTPLTTNTLSEPEVLPGPPIYSIIVPVVVFVVIIVATIFLLIVCLVLMKKQNLRQKVQPDTGKLTY